MGGPTGSPGSSHAAPRDISYDAAEVLGRPRSPRPPSGTAHNQAGTPLFVALPNLTPDQDTNGASPRHTANEQWLEKVLIQQRILFQEQLDQHHCAVMEAIVQARERPKTSQTLRAPGPAKAVTPRSKANDREGAEERGQQEPTPPTQRSQADTTSVNNRKSHVHALVSIDTPEDTPLTLRKRIAKWLEGPLGNVVGICIVLNSMSMFAHTQWLGSVAEASLGINTPYWESAELAFYITECVFGAIFFIELLLNCFAFGCDYFKSYFNIADSIIVLITTLEVLVLTPLAMSSANVSSIRLLRLAKIARAFKIVRTMSHFNSLRLLISSFIYSLASLFWSMVVMFLCLLINAIFLCQTLHEFIMDESNDEETRTWVYRMYGSGHRALYTAFEMTFAGCWPNYVRRVIEDVNPLYAIFFVLYITVIFFGMVRVISALFLKETLAQAAQDTETMVFERQRKGKKMRRELEDLFDHADRSGDGTMAMEEWEALLSHPKVVMWLREVGIEPEDATMLFELLDDGDGNVSKREFVKGVAKLKGEARAQDLVPVAANCERLLVLARQTQYTCDRLAAVLDTPIDVDTYSQCQNK